VFKLDNESKSNFQYPAGLQSAMEEVEYQEYDDENCDEDIGFETYGLYSS
jgi:hypothetical protein